jgi:hypothetical protein
MIGLREINRIPKRFESSYNSSEWCRIDNSTSDFSSLEDMVASESSSPEGRKNDDSHKGLHRSLRLTSSLDRLSVQCCEPHLLCVGTTSKADEV